MKSSRIKKVAICLLMLYVLFLGGKSYFNKQIEPININSGKEISVVIPKGSSTSKIAKILKEKNIIRNHTAFRILSKTLKTDGRMKAGEYLFTESMSSNEIIDILVKGKIMSNTVKFTIPEGFEFKQITDRLEAKGLIDKEKFIKIADYGDFDYVFLKGVKKGNNRLEGFLFPDTYIVSKNATEEEIIMKMLNRFDYIFKEEYYKKAKELNMSVNDIITLASIIEREAKVDEERAIVSSVFYNRINQGMLLQSCATVQYVLGERKSRLSLNDIDIDSPYNTYKNAGLPPKPIASPGKASIEAALYPEKTEYLYFVVKKGGGHHFSKTYKEHVNAKNSK